MAVSNGSDDEVRKWSKRDDLDSKISRLQCDAVREQAKDYVKAFQGKGGLSAALMGVCSGSSKEALFAAKELGTLIDNPGAAQKLSKDHHGLLHSFLQVGKCSLPPRLPCYSDTMPLPARPCTNGVIVTMMMVMII